MQRSLLIFLISFFILLQCVALYHAVFMIFREHSIVYKWFMIVWIAVGRVAIDVYFIQLVGSNLVYRNGLGRRFLFFLIYFVLVCVVYLGGLAFIFDAVEMIDLPNLIITIGEDLPFIFCVYLVYKIDDWKEIFEINRMVSIQSMEKQYKNQIDLHTIYNYMNRLVTENYEAGPIRNSKNVDSLENLIDRLIEKGDLNNSVSDEIVFIIELIKRSEEISGKNCELLIDIKCERDKNIPSQLLTPAVENAFKYAKVGGLFSLKILCTDDYLEFELTNEYEKFNTIDTGGMGSELMRERLELYYNGNYRLETIDKDGIFNLKLFLKL